MNKKISLGLTVALIIISASATFAITMSVSQRIYDNLMTVLRCIPPLRKLTR